ncbi:MAG: hypothetical protein K6G66_01760, partial [Oscillospiraceae bacterium]|nr:hypothetical protein [Oscillospiraceae bacterium]
MTKNWATKAVKTRTAQGFQRFPKGKKDFLSLKFCAHGVFGQRKTPALVRGGFLSGQKIGIQFFARCLNVFSVRMGVDGSRDSDILVTHDDPGDIQR